MKRVLNSPTPFLAKKVNSAHGEEMISVLKYHSCMNPGFCMMRVLKRQTNPQQQFNVIIAVMLFGRIRV